MDARTLLQSVSEAYRNVKSLEAHALSVTESRDDGFSHQERPVTFSYVAPNQARLEQGKRGMTIVSDGKDLHSYIHSIKRYSKGLVTPPHPVTGTFDPEFPHSSNNSAFLFNRIHERVADAEVQRSEMLSLVGAEAPCDVVSVTYEPPRHRGFIARGSPLVFWVNTQTHLVLRVEYKMTIETPNHDPRTSEHTLVVTHLAVDQPMDASTFEFTPPPDAVEMPPGNFNRGRGRLGGVGGGSGFREAGEGEQGVACQRSHKWDGNTFVERSEWTFCGNEIIFERGWTLSDDRAEVRISEQILGPKGPIERAVSIPVA